MINFFCAACSGTFLACQEEDPEMGQSSISHPEHLEEVEGTFEISSRGRTWWCKGPCGGGHARTEPCHQGTWLCAALQHPGTCHSARMANGAGSGVSPVHYCISDGHRFPEDDVCDGLYQPALEERGVQGEDQPVDAWSCLDTGSAQGEGTSTDNLFSSVTGGVFWIVLVKLLLFFSTQGSVKLHCQRSPLLYADRQPGLKTDVSGFNEILLEKTL